VKAGALDRRVALVLGAGTWIASAVIAVGLIVPAGTAIVNAGVALFIALPIVRVAVMLVEFLRGRDYRIAIIAALVLAVILLGIALGATEAAPGGTGQRALSSDKMADGQPE
jgi:uncharacterized membrane protein